MNQYHRLVWKSDLTGHLGHSAWFINKAILAEQASYLNKKHSYLPHWIESYKTPLKLRANR